MLSQIVPGTFPKNVPAKSSTNVCLKFSLNVLAKRSKNVFCEYSLNVPVQSSLIIFLTFLERSTGVFREHCFRTLKNSGHFLSSRNVPMKSSERAMRTFISGVALPYGAQVENFFGAPLTKKNLLIFITNL